MLSMRKKGWTKQNAAIVSTVNATRNTASASKGQRDAPDCASVRAVRMFLEGRVKLWRSRWRSRARITRSLLKGSSSSWTNKNHTWTHTAVDSYYFKHTEHLQIPCKCVRRHPITPKPTPEPSVDLRWRYHTSKPMSIWNSNGTGESRKPPVILQSISNGSTSRRHTGS